MNFKLYTSNFKGNAQNCFYPNCIEIGNADDMKKAVAYDHVCSSFTDNKRSIANFKSSNVIVMDCDNDHSNEPDKWLTFDLIEAYFPDVNYVLVTSRNNNKAKGNACARPRFHIYFPIDETTDTNDYAQIKKAVFEKYRFFDKNAVDAARFIFGNNAEVIWHSGTCNITEYLDKYDNQITLNTQQNNFSQPKSYIIPEGQRNSTLSRYAGKIIKRYGNTEKAYNSFLEKAEKCVPPLGNAELNSIWNSAQKFGEKIMRQDGYVPPDEYNNYNGDFEVEIEESGYKPKDYTDVSQARLIVDFYCDRLRFSPSTDFIAYNGSFWEETKEKAQAFVHELTDKQEADAQDRISDLTKLMYECGIMNILQTSTKKDATFKMTKQQKAVYRAYKDEKEYLTFVLKRRHSGFITSALKEAKPLLMINQKQLDGNEFLLNTPTCTIDLKTLDRLEHNYADFITKQTNVDMADAGEEIWNTALDTFFCGDRELIDYVQQIVGLSAIGKVYTEALIIAYGEGKNGKSTFWNTISKVLGTYSGNMSSDVLTTGKSRNIKPEMAELKGKRLVIASETEDGQRLSSASIKQLCSTDEIYAEKKYKDPFSFTPSHTLVLYTNHLPKVGEIDKGTWRRLIVIPFDAKISTNDDIKNYADYLFENAGGAILKWIVEGSKKIIDAGFKLNAPERVKTAVDEYMEQNNWIKHFVDECCELDEFYTEKSGELYQEYRNFCSRTGDYIRPISSFSNALQSSGFIKKRKNTGVIFFGLRLKQDF